MVSLRSPTIDPCSTSHISEPLWGNAEDFSLPTVDGGDLAPPKTLYTPMISSTLGIQSEARYPPSTVAVVMLKEDMEAGILCPHHTCRSENIPALAFWCWRDPLGLVLHVTFCS